MESSGGMNFCQQRHGGAGGAWSVAISSSSSCCRCGSLKDAWTCLANFLVSSSPGTVDSSLHQSGVLHILDFHMTHPAESKTVGSSGVFSPSSPNVSGDPCRKEATTGFNSSAPSRSALSSSSSSLPNGISGLADWLGASLSTKLTWHHLSSALTLDLQWSQLLDLAFGLGWALILFNLSISPPRLLQWTVPSGVLNAFGQDSYLLSYLLCSGAFHCWVVGNFSTPLPQLLVPLVGIQVTCGAYTPPGRLLSVPLYSFLGLPAQWQACLPLG